MAERAFGPYRLVRQIAVGGMAEIHLAKTKGLAGFEKYIALKMIHPNFAEDEEFIQMLVDEAKIAVQLNHANIAQTFDLGRVGDIFYITMEYVDGADLYKVLRRASETDVEMPLEVAAFIAKEVASALDHAHRKRDLSGKSLGIVHRDVSPQNVLISFNGEVKLVDFGIAKAASKVKQTAVGVIKGKYYYMSPEQAWGDPIDHRSDIFSAGIVLYEMITGQMLYLEEDLHKLLDMARRADIASPTTLRRGVPPQLERIVMHALAKAPGDRYQSAGDFATDLERFLHAYSPISPHLKAAALVKKIIGDPVPVPDISAPTERRDGPLSTHELSSDDLVHNAGEVRDENSMIFQIGNLQGAPAAAPAPLPLPAAPVPAPMPAPRPVAKPAVVAAAAQPARAPQPRAMTGPPAPVVAAAAPAPKLKPRGRNEETREMAPAPTRPEDESGLLPVPPPAAVKMPLPAKLPATAAPATPAPVGVPKAIPARPAPASKVLASSTLVKASPPASSPWDSDNLETDSGNDLENIGERTMVTGAPGGGFMLDAVDDGVEATMITGEPQRPILDDVDEDDGDVADDEDQETITGARPQPADHSGDDPPTIARDFAPAPAARARKVTVRQPAAPPPAALSAKIQAPAVSELRRPRPSRKTPGAGTPVPNVLQQIVGSGSASEPMPTPRPPPLPGPSSGPKQSFTLSHTDASSESTTLAPAPTRGADVQTQPGAQTSSPSSPTLPPSDGLMATQIPLHGTGPMPAHQTPAHQSYNGMPAAPGQNGFVSPMGVMTPPPGTPMQMLPGVPPHLQPYAQNQYGYPPVSPGALYQMNPYGNPPPPMPMTPTGQLRLFEADELPAQYRVSRGVPQWLKVGIAGAVAVAAAAGVTFFIIRSMQHHDKVATIHVESDPIGADVYFDGVHQNGATPLAIANMPAGRPVEIRVEALHRKPYVEMYNVPPDGGDVTFSAALKPLTGKLRIVTTPDGAEVRIDGDIRGRTPTTINDVDIEHAKKVELRLAGFQPYVQPLTWPASSEIDIDAKLVR